MEVSFQDLKEKEVVNIYDGKKLGRIIDIIFESSTGLVVGIVVPGEKKLFRKNDDIFVTINKIKRIGDDVILVGLQNNKTQNYVNDIKKISPANYYQNNLSNYKNSMPNIKSVKFNNNQIATDEGSFVRYKRIAGNKYK